MASKKKSTVPPRTQATITQQESIELFIAQDQLAQWSATCESRQRLIAEKLRADAFVEPGRFFLAGSAGVEVRQ